MQKKALLTVIGIIVLAAAVIAVVVFMNNKSTDNKATTTNVSTNQESTSESTTANPVIITYNDDGFTPSTVTVKKGTVIQVMNSSKGDLKFSSADHPTHLLETEFNLQTLTPDQSATFTPTKVGTWGYHNHLSAGQTGTVIVTE